MSAFDEQFDDLLRRAQSAARAVGPSGADDIAAETMRRAFERWESIQPYARAWVSRVARNLAIDRARASSRESELPPPVELSADQAERVALYAVLRTLPTRQREALALRYLLDLTVEQVAESMGVTLATAKEHIKRGLAAMRAKGDRYG